MKNQKTKEKRSGNVSLRWLEKEFVLVGGLPSLESIDIEGG